MAAKSKYPGMAMAFVTLHVPQAVVDAADKRARQERGTRSDVLRAALIHALGVRVEKSPKEKA